MALPHYEAGLFLRLLSRKRYLMNSTTSDTHFSEEQTRQRIRDLLRDIAREVVRRVVVDQAALGNTAEVEKETV